PLVLEVVVDGEVATVVALEQLQCDRFAHVALRIAFRSAPVRGCETHDTSDREHPVGEVLGAVRDGPQVEDEDAGTLLEGVDELGVVKVADVGLEAGAGVGHQRCPLLRLHGRHARTMLSGSLLPPWYSAMTWSNSRPESVTQPPGVPLRVRG